MIRTIDTYRSVDRSATAQITFNTIEPGDSRPYCVEAKRDGINYGNRWYMTEDEARTSANTWIEYPEGSDWSKSYAFAKES